MALSISLSSILRPTCTLNNVVVCAKKDRRSGDGFSWKRKRPRKRFLPHRGDLGDISVLYGENAVVETSDKLLKDCTRHISDYVEDGLLSKAEKVFDLMIKKRVLPNAYTYTALMKGYSFVGNTKRVSELFKEMEEKGIEPTVVTFSTALQSYTITGDLEGALCLYNQMKNRGMPKLNEYIYNSMLNVCVTARDLETARKIFKESMSSGVEANSIVINSMIDVYAECCNEKNGKRYLEECRELMKEMEIKQIKLNEQTYSTLLKLCARGELVAEAMEILTEMRANHVHPNVFSYSTVLDGISKDQKLSNQRVLELSSRIVNEMKMEEIRPDATTYNSLIAVSLRLGDLNRPVQLFKEMKTLKVEPTIVTYGTMIKCYEKLGDPKDEDAYLKPCFDLWHECEKAGMNLTIEAYTSLLSACANACNLNQAMRIWNRMTEKKKIRPNVIVFNAMINACLSKSKEDMAFEFYNKMKRSGIKPSVSTCRTFMSYYVKKKDRSGAQRIFDELKIQGVQPDKATLRMLKALELK